MLGEIDEVTRHSGGSHGCFDDGRCGAGKRDNAAVMVGITGAMKDQCARNAFNRVFNSGQSVWIAPFRKVRNAFEKRSQAVPALLRVRLMARLPSRMAMAT